MDIGKRAYLALDTAYEQGAVVLFDEENTFFATTLGAKLDHGSQVCQAIGDAVMVSEKEKVPLMGILVGVGPGSFVGIRIALATALGFTFARKLPLMGFCSKLALALSQTTKDERCYVFMKASGDLGYLTGFGLVDGGFRKTLPTKVISIADLPDQTMDGATIFSDLTEKISLLNLRSKIEHVHGPTAEGLRKAALHRLCEVGSLVDESDFLKPNYVKMPNVSMPKKTFIIGRLVG